MPKGVYPHAHIKPKSFDPDLVVKVAQLYRIGLTQAEIAAQVGLTQKVIWRLMKNHGVVARVAAKREQRGERNDSWKGDDALYEAMHSRVEASRGRPQHCSWCGDRTAARYEWANLTGNYSDVTDYERLCAKCHRQFDADRRRATGMRTSPGNGGATNE
jgi:hypothetical protein